MMRRWCPGFANHGRKVAYTFGQGFGFIAVVYSSGDVESVASLRGLKREEDYQKARRDCFSASGAHWPK